MTNTGRFVGKDCYVSFKGTVVSGDFTSVSFDESYDLADVVAGADGYHYFLPVREGDYTVDLEAFFDGVGTATWNACVPGDAGTLIIGPMGTATGKPKFSWSRVVCESRGGDIPFDDGVTMTASFHVSSAFTNGSWA